MKDKLSIFSMFFVIFTMIFILLIPKIIDKRGHNSEKAEEKIKEKESINDFSTNIIKIVNNNEDSNYLISPYSIEIALNMLKLGASNNTLREINNAVPNRNISDIRNDKVKVANAIFVKDVYKNYIEKNFYDNLKKMYDSEILFDEFKTPLIINNWVKNHTDNMIEKILEEMSEDFVLGISNAIAIDVNWLNEFECINTISAPFTKSDKTTIRVEMMNKTYTNSESKYFEFDDVKGVVIPYENDLEFVGILPYNIDKYINNLNINNLKEIDNKLISSSNENRLLLSLPRFSYSFDLKSFKEVLNVLGINDAFNGKADFTKIMSKESMSKLGIDNLYISDAIHKTYIDLNEKGTKAAAVTYFGMFKNSIAREDYNIKKIEFNKPFIYMIRDSKNKEILFFGVVKEPNIWKGSTCSNNNR